MTPKAHPISTLRRVSLWRSNRWKGGLQMW